MTGSATTDREDWQKYVEAAQRKIEIARYHLECLQSEEFSPPDANWNPPIPVQASFEGVLYALIAAEDKVAEAILRGFRLRPGRLRGHRRPILDETLDAMRDIPLKGRFREWREALIVDDVRAVRRRATHHYYSKAPSGEPGYTVEEPRGVKPYGGARGLVRYCSAAVEHAEKLLLPRLEELESELSR